MITYYIHLAFQKKTLIRSLRVALLVGIVLNLINTPELFILSTANLKIGKVLLTFLVPFLVSTYSSVLSHKTIKPGAISNLDALLKCNSCKKTNFHIHIGQEVEECPTCKEKTSWNPFKVFTLSTSENDLLKSLALFARYNPMPLFRTTDKGTILGANPASEHLFSDTDLVNQNIKELIPEIRNVDFEELISGEKLKEVVIEKSGRHFNLLLRGVPALHSIHVYGNDITEIVNAELKIKQQAHEIRQSIQYAWRIQQAMLPANETLTYLFSNNFIFYRPRNTVSGDFYWANQTDKYKIIAVADCTGHGVPGAFMSMMGISLLNEIILREKITAPSKILNTLRERLILSLKNKGIDSNVADGMDISLISIDSDNNLLRFSGAYNPLYIVRNSELLLLEADRMPIGQFVNDTVPFSEKGIDLTNGDNLFLFTDGFKDQTGGEKLKKYSSKQFKSLLIEISKTPSQEQGQLLGDAFDNWKQEQEQVDDVLVIGLQV
ncbi:MAG: SpoIIE family protein phosphatase [Bacteroidales bacterium]|nr:SpoIIE family protein phosphatase [Bacteroidales bacterium]